MTQTTHTGSCHCGAVAFEVDTELAPAVRCNCSLCRRKGIVMTAPFVEGDLRIVKGRDALSIYRFNTQVAEHYFCRQCGVHVFNKTRRDPRLWRANLGCLDGIDPYAFEATLLDGAATSLIDDA